jgi:hypothetical protein
LLGSTSPNAFSSHKECFQEVLKNTQINKKKMDPELFAEALKIEEQVKAISRYKRRPYGVATFFVQPDIKTAVDIKKRLIDAHPELPSMVSRVFYGEPVEDSCHVVISSAMMLHVHLPDDESTYTTPGLPGDLISNLATFNNIMKMSEGCFFPYQDHELPFDVLDSIPSTPEVKRCAVQFWEILDCYYQSLRNDSEVKASVVEARLELDEACREALHQMLSVHTKSASKKS